MPEFSCSQCGADFAVAESVLGRYPGWTPKLCLRCKGGGSKDRAKAGKRTPATRPRRGATAASSATREEDLTVAEVLERYHDGPSDGVFTDGASHPNPGPGGWGAVYVVGGEIRGELLGSEPDTTNNRMELTALIAAFDLVPPGTQADIWTDSQLCVRTINEWAPGWAKNGWKRKTGAIKNLDLVKKLYSLAGERPELTLRWIKAHSGFRWNEYADALATAYRRDTR